MQNFICGAARAVRAGDIRITGDHCSCDTYQSTADPYKIINGPVGSSGRAVALINGSNGFFHIGPKLIEIANFGPELDTIQRNTGRNWLHRHICVSVAVHNHGVRLILAGDAPLDWVCILDRGQADKIRQFGIKCVQLLHNPI